MAHTQQQSMALGIWLLICAATVWLMVVVGGVTRLTQSGLSMVEWAPIMGTLPPLSEAAWLTLFQKYQAFPEYQIINAGMSLADFKQIFWWEYGHRVLGRFIGLIYLLPLLYFWMRGRVPKGWGGRLFGLFVLGGLQGLMGWYMVQSGLVDVPHVSQYRLTAHLGLALLIFACMLWFAMDFLRGELTQHGSSANYRSLTALTCVVIFIMMLSGGFVAGTKAGFIMNTFPQMNGQWLPDDLWALSPIWRNFFDNPITVQFTHRLIAIAVAVMVLAVVLLAPLQGFKTRSGWLLAALILQVSLGISALLMVVPVSLGAAHQAGAVLLFGVALWCAHTARKKQRIIIQSLDL